MTVILLEMPKPTRKLHIPTAPESTAPPTESTPSKFFRLKPLVWNIEQAFKQEYGIRYLQITALTSLLQIQELLLKGNRYDLN